LTNGGFHGLGSQHRFYTVSDMPLECAWSRALAALPGAMMPVRGLGASDCRSGCAAHLIGLPPKVNVQSVLETVALSTVVSLQFC
jgi:Uri superfamily endonuclease